MRFTIQFLLGLIILAWPAQPTFGIVRRDDVADSEFIDLSALPEYEAVGWWNPTTSCGNGAGGTVIHPQWILTAAHCTPASTSTGVFSLGADSSNPDATYVPDTWIRNSAYSGATIVSIGRDFGLIHFPTPILDVTPAQLFRSGSEAGRIATVIGYGRSGTGLTGQQSGTQGTRRGATNRIDGFGNIIGGSSNLFVGDFDNPNNPGDSVLGTNTPTDMEGLIAIIDSGGGWFIDVGGTTYLAGVSSFLAETDGSANADYGDIFGAGRVKQELPWIESNADVAVFWTAANATWATGNNWDSGTVPVSATTTVVKQGIASIDAAVDVEYLFIDGTGRVRLNAPLEVDQAIVKRGGVLEIGANGAGSELLTGNYRQTDGTLDFVIHDFNARGTLAVTSLAEIGGQLNVSYGSGYEGPASRGQVDLHIFLIASDIQGQFDTVNGIPIGTTMTYAGETEGGLDGLFRSLTYDATQTTLNEYLALPADANGDGAVDVDDFDIWNTNKFSNGTDWTTGDFNGDGATDLSDLHIWNSNKNTSVSLPVSVVPEPNAGLLMFVGLALSVLAVRVRRPYPASAISSQPLSFPS